MRRPISPEHIDVLEASLELERMETSTAQPAKVQRYDADAQTVDLVPLLKRPYPVESGSYDWIELPAIPCVPVCWPGAGAWFLACSLGPGDTGLMVSCEGSIGGWWAGVADGPVASGDIRRHHVESAVFLPGLRQRRKKLAHAPTGGDNALVIGRDEAGGTRISMYGDGSVKITQGSTVVAQLDTDGTWHFGGAAGDLVALAGLVNDRLASIRTAFNGHTHVIAGTTATAGAPIVATNAPPSAMAPLADVSATKVKAI